MLPSYRLDKLNYSRIFNLSYYFYQRLLEHPKFLKTCRKIGLNNKQHLPSKEMFKNFVINFITQAYSDFKITKGTVFIQSIALLSFEHIVHWSQTHLTKYIYDERSYVWSNIFDSINISTDKNCYWRVLRLFNKKKLIKVNEQLDKLEHDEIVYSNNLIKNDQGHLIMFHEQLIVTPSTVLPLIN